MELFKFVAALVITLGLLGGTLWLLRRWGHLEGPARSIWHRETKVKHLRSLERLALSSECALHLIEVNDQPMLIAVSNQSVVPIPIHYDKKNLSQVAGGIR